jgi:hypothetical protein
MSDRLRVITAGFPGPYAPRIFERTLRQLPVDSCMTICKAREYLPDLPGVAVAWHPTFRFRDDEDLPVDWNTAPPLDEAFVQSMRHCESVVLTMLERYEMHGDVITYQERQREYLRQLRYWNHVLDARRINLFLLPDIPHLPLTYVLYCLCKKKNIPALYFSLCPIPDTFFIIEDWERSSDELAKAYASCLERYEHTERESIPLSDKFEAYYRAQTAHAADPVIWYMKWKLPTRFGRWRTDVLRLLREEPRRFLQKATSFLGRHLQPQFGVRRRMLREASRALRFYGRHALPPDFARKFVYVALHVQPESTTTPLAGGFADQLLWVQMLSALLPPDVHLYVKEHPRQWEYFPYGTGRSRAFYEDLLSVPRVHFVPMQANTFELTHYAQAVVTATGSAGFEALFRGKPVIMFGHTYYQFARGVYTIHTLDDCRNAVDAIFVRGERPAPSDMRVFLKAMEEVAVDGYFDQEYHEVSRFTDEENVARVSESLLAHIRTRLR